MIRHRLAWRMSLFSQYAVVKSRPAVVDTGPVVAGDEVQRALSETTSGIPRRKGSHKSKLPIAVSLAATTLTSYGPSQRHEVDAWLCLVPDYVV